MPVIHGVSASPFVRKVRVALEEKGLEYDLEPVMPGNVPDSFRKLTPVGKVPVYVDGELVLPDSSVICAYLERTHPEPRLYPADDAQYGRALWFEEYADTKIVEVVAPVFSQRFVQTKLMKQPSDEAIVAQHLEVLIPPVLDYLESQLREDAWMVGDDFGIADISIGTVFVNLRHGGEAVDAARWPRLRAYLDRVHARPSFERLIEEEVAAFGDL